MLYVHEVAAKYEYALDGSSNNPVLINRLKLDIVPGKSSLLVGKKTGAQLGLLSWLRQLSPPLLHLFAQTKGGSLETGPLANWCI